MSDDAIEITWPPGQRGCNHTLSGRCTRPTCLPGPWPDDEPCALRDAIRRGEMAECRYCGVAKAVGPDVLCEGCGFSDRMLFGTDIP